MRRLKSSRETKRIISPLFIVLLMVFFLAGIAYIANTWKASMRITEDEAKQLALTAEAGFSKFLIRKLAADASDLDRIEYKEIKNSLMNLVNQKSQIRFAYIYLCRNGKIYFLANSEPAGSEGYAPPGQEYREANEEIFLPFENGQALRSSPYSDRWGTWISVLVPMKDMETGETIAAFGVDYPAGFWNERAVRQSSQAGIVAFCLTMVFIALYATFAQNKILRDEKEKILGLSKKLQESEILFRAIFHQAPIGIAIGHNDRYIISRQDNKPGVNPMFEKITGWTKEELARISWQDITHADDLPQDLENFEKFKSGEIGGYDMEKRYIKPDGSEVWIHMIIAPLQFNSAAGYNHLCLIEDISSRKKMEKVLYDSERSKAVLLDNLLGMAYRCYYDREWTMQFLSGGCFALTGYKPESLVNNRDLSYNQLITPEYSKIVWDEWERAINLKEQFRYEYEIITASGKRKWVLETGQGIYNENGSVEALEGIVIDITESKQWLFQLQYMDDHDFMTGLYNRRYFEEAKSRMDNEDWLPLSVIVGDINGVRLINDAFGHAEGDRMITEAAKILQGCCREDDILARTGGDEFCILLPYTDYDEGYEILRRIINAFEQYNLLAADRSPCINLSTGYGIKKTGDESIQAASKEAEELMYKHKLLESDSYHNTILSSIMATMYARSQETQEHAARLAELSKMMGRKLNLSQKNMDELELFAMLHDIGKVGIDDRILNKPGKLSDDELVIMKKHPEIGYKIIMSSPELESIAEYILSHHERWDGRGYPRGLKTESIPLLSRILAVADTYDAMTEDRVYRKAMTREAAIEEIGRHAGTQFDPQIVRIFIENI